jgi:hypothetical protein
LRNEIHAWISAVAMAVICFSLRNTPNFLRSPVKSSGVSPVPYETHKDI